MEGFHGLKDLFDPSLSRGDQRESEEKVKIVVWDEADFEEGKDQ